MNSKIDLLPQLIWAWCLLELASRMPHPEHHAWVMLALFTSALLAIGVFTILYFRKGS